MNIKRLRLVNEFLTEQMNHWLLFPLPLTVMGISRESTGQLRPNLLLWVLCGLFPLMFFLLRQRSEKLISFLLLHFLVVGLAFLVPAGNIVGRVICVICAVGYMLHSLILRFKKGDAYSGPIQLPVGVSISACSILLQHYQGTGSWDAYYVFPLIGGIALFFFVFYIQRYLDFLTVNQSSTGHLPASEIFRSGIGLVLGFTTLGALILIAATHLNWFSSLVQALKNLLYRLLRYLFSLFPQGTPEADIPNTEEMDYSQIAPSALPSGQAHWFWRVLEVVIGLALVGILLYLITRIVVKLIQLIQERFAFRRFRPEGDNEDAFDLREKCDLERGKERRRKSRLSSFTPSDQIRKIYKRRLLSSVPRMSAEDSRRLSLYTAREWEKKLLTDGMADLYEQARYSTREMTGEDVKKMKDICRQ